MSAFDEIAIFEVGGATIEYYPAGDEIPPVLVADVRGWSYAKESHVVHHPRLRRAVLRLRGRDVTRAFGVLHWDAPPDLDALDASVRSGSAGAPALDGTLFGSLHHAQCRRCASTALVVEVDAGLPFNTIAKRRARTFSTSCPNCGADDFVPHLEVLDG